MAMTINAQRNLGLSGNTLGTTMQRLSSGLRVNSAKDDAAGLAIAERMNAQARGLAVAARNANDGISLAQTTEGALGKVGDMLQRMRELAVQASNATNSDSDRAALQSELSQLTSEIDRVAKTTSFNGTKVLDGSFTGGVFQVGASAGDNITIKGTTKATADGLGNVTYGSSVSKAIDTSKLEGLDEEQTLTIQVGDADAVSVTVKAASSGSERMGQIVSAINGKTADTGVTAFLQAGEKSGEYTIAVKSESGEAVTFGGTAVDALTAATGATAVEKTYGFEDELQDLNDAIGAYKADKTEANAEALEALATTLNAKISGFGTGAAGANEGAALAFADEITTMDGVATAGTFVEGDFDAALATFEAAVTTATDATKTALDDALTTAQTAIADLEAGDDVAAALTDLNNARTAVGLSALTTTAPAGTTEEDIAEFQGAVAEELDALGLNVLTSEVKQHKGIDQVDISTQAGAWDAIKKIDSAIDQVNSARADLGALQTRFERSIENIDIMNENITASRGRIVDADFATETANLSRAQILQQAGTAMVAQANQLPQQVLSLLQ